MSTINKIMWPDGKVRMKPNSDFNFWVGDILWKYSVANAKWMPIESLKEHYESIVDSKDRIYCSLEQIVKALVEQENKCECGSEDIGSNMHSYCCPKAKKIYA